MHTKYREDCACQHEDPQCLVELVVGALRKGGYDVVNFESSLIVDLVRIHPSSRSGTYCDRDVLGLVHEHPGLKSVFSVCFFVDEYWKMVDDAKQE